MVQMQQNDKIFALLVNVDFECGRSVLECRDPI